MVTQIKIRRDKEVNWTSENPTLALGEIGIESDTNKLKIGDGLTAWTSLAYFGGAGYTNLTEFVGQTAYRLFYSDVSGDVTELALGADGTFLKSNGASAAPTFSAAAGGYTNLTEFIDQTAYRLFYSDASGDVTELALGTDGTFLKSNGASAAPTFAVPAGSGDVSKDGTPVDNQVGVWTGDGTIEGTANLTYNGTTFGVTGAITITEAMSIAADKKLNLEGSAGNTYFIYNSSTTKVELFVNGTKRADWG